MPDSNSPKALVFADFMFGARVNAALLRMGWTPLGAGTPDAAMIALKESRPDLAIIELGARGSDRTEWIRQVRETKAYADLPLLAFGSHKSKSLLNEAKDAGATLVVSNGMLVSRFEEMVERAMGETLSPEDRLVTEADADEDEDLE